MLDRRLRLRGFNGRVVPIIEISDDEEEEQQQPQPQPQQQLCRICYVSPREMAVLPCGHLCACQACAHLWGVVNNNHPYFPCPVCRTRH